MTPLCYPQAIDGIELAGPRPLRAAAEGQAWVAGGAGRTGPLRVFHSRDRGASWSALPMRRAWGERLAPPCCWPPPWEDVRELQAEPLRLRWTDGWWCFEPGSSWEARYDPARRAWRVTWLESDWGSYAQVELLPHVAGLFPFLLLGLIAAVSILSVFLERGP